MSTMGRVQSKFIRGLPRAWSTLIVAGILLALSARQVVAQRVIPFYSETGTAFTPEIGVVNTGVLNDARVVVSADEKYVTLTMGAESAGLIALHEFAFQTPAVPVAAANPTARPQAVEATILDWPGITRIN